MRQALGLARRGLGDTWPNPSVGCVIVQDGVVVGRGHTRQGGRPHAETEALAHAGSRARGATAYVTLEPCAHHGKTAPCADALVAAGINRVVAAMQDPDPRVAGSGLNRLRDAGIAVTEGVLHEHAAAIIAGFVLRVEAGRPLFAAKLATSLDGRIATHGGESKWITGEPARRQVQLLRAQHDAVMVGSTTAVADDPDLTCRMDGFSGRPKVRIVVDGRLRLPLTAKLVRSARLSPVWLFTRKDADRLRRQAYADAGVEVIPVEGRPDAPVDLGAVAAELGRRGLTSVLVEGGGTLIATLLRENLLDRLHWFRAPRLIGGDGLAGVAPYGVARLADSAAWRRTGLAGTGDDIVETLVRAF
jgi:diaminohydroxyphosphoribosylaminopyrimidine deaminase/5-amino-6-(5-phosphoribosylamino)uracil reductase